MVSGHNDEYWRQGAFSSVGVGPNTLLRRRLTLKIWEVCKCKKTQYVAWWWTRRRRSLPLNTGTRPSSSAQHPARPLSTRTLTDTDTN